MRISLALVLALAAAAPAYATPVAPLPPGPEGYVRLSDYALAVGDIDGDGRADAVVGGANVFQLLKGRADGQLAEPVNVEAAVTPVALAIADVSGEGAPDLIGLSRDAGGHVTLTVALARTAGAFEPPRTLSLAAAAGLSAGDVNGDGRADVLAGTQLLISDGDGGFHPAPPTGEDGKLSALADVTGDGRLDLLVAEAERVVLRAGNGDGTFGAPQQTALTDPATLSVADVSGDGRPDALVTTARSRLFVLTVDGGRLAAASQPTCLSADMAAAGDANGDGHSDLFAAERKYPEDDNGGLCAYLGGSGLVPAAAPGLYRPADLEDLWQIAFADVDGDGRADLVDRYGTSVTVHPGGSFDPRPVPALLRPGEFEPAGIAADTLLLRGDDGRLAIAHPITATPRLLPFRHADSVDVGRGGAVVWTTCAHRRCTVHTLRAGAASVIAVHGPRGCRPAAAAIDRARIAVAFAHCRRGAVVMHGRKDRVVARSRELGSAGEVELDMDGAAIAVSYASYRDDYEETRVTLVRHGRLAVVDAGTTGRAGGTRKAGGRVGGGRVYYTSVRSEKGATVEIYSRSLTGGNRRYEGSGGGVYGVIGGRLYVNSPYGLARPADLPDDKE